MDAMLLKDIKSSILELTKTYGELCGEENIINESNKTQIIYEIMKKNIEAIYQVNESVFLTSNYNYLECSKELKPLLKNQILLAVLFQKEQNNNIIETNKRMDKGDTQAYLDENNFRDPKIINYSASTSYIKVVEKIEEYMHFTIQITKQRYTESFGYFNSTEEANEIIKREYGNYLKFAKLFLNTKETIYEFYDNYDPLINGLENLSYELIQLISVLERAYESKNLIEKKKNLDSEVYFILMDGVNSTIDKNTEQLISDTMNLNKEIAESKDVNLLCKFGTYKQDEIQGFIIGDIDQFLKLVDRVYSSQLKVTYAQRPYARIREYIENIEETVFNIPFYIYGSICKEARNHMNSKKYIILGNNSIKDKSILLQELIEDSSSRNFLA